MAFTILGLDPKPYQHLFKQPDDYLAEYGAERVVADAHPGYPDRIELRDAEPGETLLLLNYTHQPANNPYRASHAIFLLESGAAPFCESNTVPKVMQLRALSLRAFDRKHRMIDAALIEGKQAAQEINRLLDNGAIDYLHAHYALRGCFAAKIVRSQ